MKTILFFIAILTFFSSCTSYNKIIILNDSFKEEKSIKLIQYPDGYSDEIKGLIFDRADYNFYVKHVYSQPKNQTGQVILELKMTTQARPEKLDSIIYILADGTKFKLKSTNFSMLNYVNRSTSTSSTITSEITKDDEDSTNKENKETAKTSTTSSTTITDETLQAMKHNFEIQPEMWPILSNSNKIMLRVYIENEGIDIRFNSSAQNKITDFYHKVIDMEEGYLTSTAK